MTQADKDLLLRDLSARLPYGVIVHTIWNYIDTNGKILRRETDRPLAFHDLCDYWNCKPYLRPVSSMTEEERNEYLSIKMQETERVALAEVYRPEAISEIMDWLNKHHFDYRGLISKSLALEAPDDMYN